MMMLVKRNMTSARLSQKRSIVARLDSCTNGERDAEEDGEDSDLEDLAFGNALREVLRKDVDEEIVPVRGRRSSGCEPVGVNAEPHARLADVDGEAGRWPARPW